MTNVLQLSFICKSRLGYESIEIYRKQTDDEAVQINISVS